MKKLDNFGQKTLVKVKSNTAGENFLINVCFQVENAQKITIFIEKMENFGPF